MPSLEDGFYWVRVMIDGEGTWVVAELELGDSWFFTGKARRFKRENILEVDEKRIMQGPYWKVETISPERAREMIEKVHRRYRDTMGWDDLEKARECWVPSLERLEKGWRPTCVVDTKSGELFDGAYGMRALAEHSEPVEVAVAYKEQPDKRGTAWPDAELGKAWSYLKMADEDRPPFARGAR